ncbi:MAG: TFIIB-type zinc ribbon-containing protein [Clostridiales bacterium]|nr:TFIIB-type zinc ribbon-containing protein [Clostridiales bacterium]
MAIQEFKCPNCGGAIQFNPGTQEMTCPYCDSVMDVEALKTMDEELAQNQESESINWGYEGGEWSEGEQQGLAVYSCKSCGGEIVGDETLGATSCPFCGNPVVLTSKFAGTLRPDMLIPFKLGKDVALEALQKHYLGKRLLPKVFQDQNHLDEVKGIYVPFWLFDAEADANIEYSATKIRNWSDKNYNYSETSVFRVVREGGIGFSHVPVDGSKAMDDTLMESIEPFTMTEAVDFKVAYLAGYFANKYDVDAEKSTARANERIKNSTASAFAGTVTGYSTVTPRSTSIRLKSGGVRYALFPVWLLSTSWESRNFVFAMNGQTGKFVGDLPLDKAAYKAWFIKIFGGAAAALLIISQIIVGLM